MNRIVIPIAVLVIAAVVFGTRVYWIPSGGVGHAYLGYVEAETTLVAAPVGGRLVALSVTRGAPIEKDAPLFSLDTTEADAEVARSRALLEQSRAQLENLLTGRRPEELDVIRAQRREAEAALAYAKLDLQRTRDLMPRGAATASRLDQATSQVAQLEAKVQSLTAEEAAGTLGGRAAEREAARAKVAESETAVRKAKRNRLDIAPRSPVDGRVENTFYEPGEWVPAGTPVVSLIAHDKTKLRFFMPQAHVARAAPGTRIDFTCDGCPSGLQAEITYVAPRAEFTPPVIYSAESRDKLVFLVEARPLQETPALRIGLPVEVRPLEGAS